MLVEAAALQLHQTVPVETTTAGLFQGILGIG